MHVVCVSESVPPPVYEPGGHVEHVVWPRPLYFLSLPHLWSAVKLVPSHSHPAGHSVHVSRVFVLSSLMTLLV